VSKFLNPRRFSKKIREIPPTSHCRLCSGSSHVLFYRTKKPHDLINRISYTFEIVTQRVSPHNLMMQKYLILRRSFFWKFRKIRYDKSPERWILSSAEMSVVSNAKFLLDWLSQCVVTERVLVTTVRGTSVTTPDSGVEPVQSDGDYSLQATHTNIDLALAAIRLTLRIHT
jgi:hypothetical protein